MGEIPRGLEVNVTKKLALHAPGDDVVVWCGVQQDQLVAGRRHGGSAQFGLENQHWQARHGWAIGKLSKFG